MKPLVRIQIVTYNSEDSIINCLKHVRQQTGNFQKEIVVIDNGSIDNTVGLINEFFGEVILIINESNTGYAGGHNKGLEYYSKYDYLLTLNPDVELKENYIHSLVEVLSKDNSFGSAFGLLLRPDEKTIDSMGIAIRKNRRPYDKYQGEPPKNEQVDFDAFGPCGAAAIYKREFIEDVSIDNQFFDEDFFIYKEDVDVCWRGQLLGWSSVFLPLAVAIHERGWKNGDRKHINKIIKIHSFKNRYLLLIKNDDLINFLFHFPHIIFFELAAHVYLIVKEPFLLKSWFLILRNLPRTLLKRKQIMTKRKVSAKEIRKWFF